jgi:hypothetical protein
MSSPEGSGLHGTSWSRTKNHNFFFREPAGGSRTCPGSRPVGVIGKPVRQCLVVVKAGRETPH